MTGASLHPVLSAGSALWSEFIKPPFRGCCYLCTFMQQTFVECLLWSRLCVLGGLLNVQWKVDTQVSPSWSLQLMIRIKQGFSTFVLSAQIILCWGVLSCVLFSSIPGLATHQMPVATSIPSYVEQKYLQTLSKSPWGQNPPQLRTTGIGCGT